MSEDPKAFNRPQAEFLSSSDIDSVGRAVLALAMELSVTNDRLIVLEDMIERTTDQDVTRAIAIHSLSDAAKNKMASERERIVNAVIKALSDE